MGQKAVFLDRDGVINDNVRAVNRPEDLVVFPNVGQAVKRAGTRTVFIGTGHREADFQAPTLPDAVRLIVQNGETD